MTTTTNAPRKLGVLEFIGKHKATFDAITVLAEKLGQKDVKPAADLKLTVRVPNEKLKALQPELYAFCYENAGKNTGSLEGIQVVSGEPNLTPWFVKMGSAIGWEYEQTGCTLKIYWGTGAKPKITLRSCTVKKLAIDCHESGTTDWTFHVYTADLDEDVFGQLAVLKTLERDIELEAPDIISQQRELGEEEDELGGGGALTPEKALAKHAKNDSQGRAAA